MRLSWLRSCLALLAGVTGVGAVCLGQTGQPDLIPALPSGWASSSPRPDLAPVADVVATGGISELRLRSSGPATDGEWHGTVKNISGGRTYHFAVEYQPSGVEHEDLSVPVILSWLSASGKPVQRDYITGISAADEGWHRASRTLRAPVNATAVTIELVLRWSAGGSVIWKDPQLTAAEDPPHRKIRVVTTNIRSKAPATVEKNLELMATTLDQAGTLHPDLVVLTECLVNDGVPLPLAETAEPIPGPATQMLSEKAQRYKTWIVAALNESDGGRIYDTAVLIDRQGRIAGKYHKVQLTLGEADLGITPGNDYPVFDTDFGRVGMMICWDNFFPEPARILALKGADIVVLPINGDGVPGHWDVISRARAIDNAVFFVASSMYALSPSVIIDPDGRVLASTAEGIASADLDLDQTTHVANLSVGVAIGEPKGLYLKERHPDSYGPLMGLPAPAQ